MEVVLVTCRELPGLHPDDGPLVDAFADAGVRTRIVAWDDPSWDWSSAALVIIRSAWDYVERRADFVRWAEHVASVTRLWNPVEVVRWNTDKSYLREFAEAGLPVVPTRWLPATRPADLGRLLDTAGWGRAIVKPLVSAGSLGAIRVDRSDADQAQSHLDTLLRNGGVMVQPYLEQIETAGEVSVVSIAGHLTHAVRKHPATGDFRVQEEFGGTEEPVTVEGDLLAATRAVLDHAGGELPYARVDLIAHDGAWQLTELELVEPQLFFRHCPSAAERLAIAAVAHLAVVAERSAS